MHQVFLKKKREIEENKILKMSRTLSSEMVKLFTPSMII